MEVFEGTVRLAGDVEPLRAILLVADNRLRVRTSHHEIGDWGLSELHTRVRPDGCHIVAEGEELIVSVDEPMQFAEAIGPSVANPGDGSLLGRDSEGQPNPVVRAVRFVGGRLWAIPTAGKVAVGALALSAALYVLAPAALIALILAVGLIALLVGGYAAMDSFTAVRLPEGLSPHRLIRAGAAGLVVAILLAVLI